MFRYICKKSDGSLLSYVFNSDHEAYKHCVPEDSNHWHIKLFPIVQQQLNIGGSDAVLVSYDEDHPTVNHVYTAHYIQLLTDGYTTPFPDLVMPQPKPSNKN